MAGKFSILILLLILFLGLFADILSPYSHKIPSGKAFVAPNINHWLGTDDLGIDLWAQICHGARISLIIGIGSALLAGLGGCIIGVIAGYFGGLTDRIIMRITDLMIIIPDIPLMIVLGVFLEPSIYNIIFVLTLVSWTGSARIVRSKILAMKEEKYIIAAKAYGATFNHLITWHFLPGIYPIVVVSIIRLTGRAIVAEAGLAFLGLGDPTSKSWGLILNHAINFKGIYFTDFWHWWVMAPLLSIILLVMGIALLGRDCEKLVNSKI